jgi:hypothetical protein
VDNEITVLDSNFLIKNRIIVTNDSEHKPVTLNQYLAKTYFNKQLNKNETILFIDGNRSNIHPSNLKIGEKPKPNPSPITKTNINSKPKINTKKNSLLVSREELLLNYQKFTKAQLRQKYQISAYVLDKLLTQYRIPPPRLTQQPLKEELEQKLIEFNVKELAKFYKVPRLTIYIWINKYNINLYKQYKLGRQLKIQQFQEGIIFE